MDRIDIRVRRLTHGITLEPHKSASVSVPLEPAPIPNEILQPLEAGLAARDIRPAVRTGQRVLRGQPLVEGGGPLSTWTHASTSGVVRSLETHPVAHARRREALCALIEVDGEDELWPELSPPDVTTWDTPDKLALALSRAGLAGLGGAVFPTGVKVAATWRHEMRSLIVNGAECEPYISCDDMLMRTFPRDVIAGALTLTELTGAEHGFVAVEEDKPEAIEGLERELATLDAGERLSIVTVPAAYPAGSERQLIHLLTGHEVPSLARPTDIGYLCQNVGTVVALYRYLRSGHPLTSRITTVTGGGVEQPRNLEVRLGTRVADLIAACGGYKANVERLIMGGSMMGIALDSDSVPVTRATNCIIAATEQELEPGGDALPCIRCGNCDAVCPALLQPQELHREAAHDHFDVLETIGLFDCIECGCCDVVCPSHIRLTESFRVAKRRFVQAMDYGARVSWYQSRERLRDERARRWVDAHEPAAREPTTPRQRADAVVDVIARVGQLST